MLTVERRLDKLEEDRQKGGRDKGDIEREQALFTRLMEVLGGSVPLRDADLSDEERQRVGGFGLLSLIPILVVYNTSEGGVPIEPVEGDAPNLLIHGKIEMEIAQLPPEDEEDFLTEYGISEPGRERVIRASYDTLGLLTFFTGNDEEARAWTLRRGSTCLEAADAIHSDMARGFIRAEVIAWDELVALGSLPDARAQGKLRVEGKDYIVSDGDVLYIRFNV
jgi:ribosome-binding ATPase YchF (GTP1/OBG family)